MIKKPLTIRQAAKELGVSHDTLRRWDKAGKLKAPRHPINNYRIYPAPLIEKMKNKLYAINKIDNLRQKHAQP